MAFGCGLQLMVPAAASTTRAATRIYFVNDSTGHFEIYSMGHDGSDVRQLSHASYDHLQPSLSPDRHTVVFAGDPDGRHFHIYSMAASGKGREHQITSESGSQERPQWDPAGGLIAYQSSQTGSDNIWVMRPDGTHRVNLTSDKTNETFPAWAPGGHRIAFASDRGGAKAFDVSAIYLMNANGSGRKRVTPLRLNAGDESFSPNGKNLVFSSNLCNTCNNSVIYTSTVHGATIHQLTHAPRLNLGGPRWSPDGKHLVFWGGVWVNKEQPQDIYTMTPKGTHLANLTRSATVNDSDPTWVK
jgi:TolB protein